MTTKEFSHALGDVSDKYVNESINYTAAKKKNVWVKWGAMAACLCLVVVGAVTIPNLQNELPYEQEHPEHEQGLPEHQIMLQYNEVSSIMSSAPLYSEDIAQVETDITEISELLGYDMDSCIPDAMKSYDIKYYIVTNTATNEILSVAVDAKEVRDTTPRPGIRVEVGFGKRPLIDYVFYEEETVYSTIHGVEVCATVVPERTWTNASGKEKTTPAVYIAEFEHGEDFYYIESRGALEQVIFDELVCSLVKAAATE